MSNLEIGILVNNVGMTATYPEMFIEHHSDPKVDNKIEGDAERIQNLAKKLVNCNITSMNAMTRYD